MVQSSRFLQVKPIMFTWSQSVKGESLKYQSTNGLIYSNPLWSQDPAGHPERPQMKLVHDCCS